MTSEGLGEVFESDSADMCAGKYPLVLMGGRANGQAYADGERGRPSAQAEIYTMIIETYSIVKNCTLLFWRKSHL
jgi:hypothetical protein